MTTTAMYRTSRSKQTTVRKELTIALDENFVREYSILIRNEYNGL